MYPHKNVPRCNNIESAGEFRKYWGVVGSFIVMLAFVVEISSDTFARYFPRKISTYSLLYIRSSSDCFTFAAQYRTQNNCLFYAYLLISASKCYMISDTNTYGVKSKKKRYQGNSNEDVLHFPGLYS